LDVVKAALNYLSGAPPRYRILWNYAIGRISIRKIALTFSLAAAALVMPVTASPAAITIGSKLDQTPSQGCQSSYSSSPQPFICETIQREVGFANVQPGGSVAPVNGVVVRWRFRTGTYANAGTTAALRIYSGTQLSATSDAVAVPTTAGQYSFDTRLPIAAGANIGVLQLGNSSIYDPLGLMVYPTPGSGSYDMSFTPYGFPPQGPIHQTGQTLALNADIEPDADGDGYGDETQDLCAVKPGEQTACSPPVITGAKFKKGTGFVFTLSEPATVGVAIDKLNPGRLRKGKCSSHARRGKRCSAPRRFATINGLLAPAGAATIPYVSKRLKKGTYAATIVAVAPNLAQSSATIKFKLKK
jgi:hypothetical protein